MSYNKIGKDSINPDEGGILGRVSDVLLKLPHEQIQRPYSCIQLICRGLSPTHPFIIRVIGSIVRLEMMISEPQMARA